MARYGKKAGQKHRAPECRVEMLGAQPGMQDHGVGKAVRNDEIEADDEGAGQGDGAEIGGIEQACHDYERAERQGGDPDAFTGGPQQTFYAACLQAFRHSHTRRSGETHPNTLSGCSDQTRRMRWHYGSVTKASP